MGSGSSIVAVIFLGVGISCRKSSEAVVFEVIGIPLLFLKQNSPLFIPVIFAVMVVDR